MRRGVADLTMLIRLAPALHDFFLLLITKSNYMKKLFLLTLSALFFLVTSAAVIPGSGDPDAKKVMLLLPGTSQAISLADFTSLTPGQYKALTGKKLSLKEKIGLKIIQRQVGKTIQRDGTVNTEKLKKKFGFFDRWSWHWGGAALGLLVVLGPIIALFFRDDYKWDRFWSAMTVTSLIISGILVFMSAGIL